MWPFSRKAKPVPRRRREPTITVNRRSFEAAKVDRLKSSWSTAPLTINDIIRRDLRQLRARSRHQGQNDPYARRFLQMCRSHVIGPDGILFQSRLKKRDGTLRRKLNQAREAAWRRWSRPEFCDMERKLGLAEMMRQAVATVAEDGECIIRMVEGVEAGEYGFALQFIDAERLDILLDREASQTQNAIRMGIELDEWQRPVAYWFSSSNGDYYYQGQHYRRIPADEIIHLYLPFRAGAWRGVPWTATSLTRLNMLDGYEDAALVNARVGASKMGFFLTEDGMAPMVGAEETDGSITVSAEPGEFETLPATVKDFKEFNPAYPMGEFPSFVKQILRGVSAGLGVSYHTLSGDLESVNFTSGRLGTQEDREVWKQLQNWFIDAVCHRIQPRWERQAILRGLVDGADYFDLNEYKMAVGWQPRRWPHIQPREESAARELAIKLRLASRSQFIREDGNDPDEVWAECEAEERMMRDHQLDPTLPDWQPPEPKTQPAKAAND